MIKMWKPTSFSCFFHFKKHKFLHKIVQMADGKEKSMYFEKI